MSKDLKISAEWLEPIVKEMHHRSVMAMWSNIIEMGNSDPVLHDMLDQCIIYYKLKKDYGET